MKSRSLLRGRATVYEVGGTADITWRSSSRPAASTTPPASGPTVVLQVNQRGLFGRTLWYLCTGWWLSGPLTFAAACCIASVVLLPAGLALVNQLPQVMTLRPRSLALRATTGPEGSVTYDVGQAEQRSMLVRCAYFLLAGWWACMLVMSAAWFLCSS